MATAREVDLVNADTALRPSNDQSTSVYPSEKKFSSDDHDHNTYEASSTDIDADSFVDEDGNPLEEPTEEDQRTLRRIADKIPIAAYSVVIVELCERFAYYGLSGPFQNYLQNPLPDGGSGTGAPPPGSPAPAGALGRTQTTATGLQNMFSFLAYITPIIGAIIADSKWGRYKTITVFCFIYFIGLLIITLTSIPSALRAGAGFPGWIVGAIIVATGTGGIKANVSPLVADQYRKSRMFVRTLPSGERVIVDPNVTITRIYNIFYWCINVGSLSAIATTESERHVGFWLAYLLPTVVFLGTPIVLIASRKAYYKVPPKGSIVMEVWRCWRIAMGGFWTHPIRFLRETKETGIWNRAKPHFHKTIQGSGAADEKIVGRALDSRREHWITWDDAFVEEVKRTARACQIFLFYPLYWISYNQITTNLVSMAGTMTLNGTPNDLIQNFDPIALIILIPIMDTLVYPGLRRMGFVARPIFRIWLGFMFGALAMVYSAVLQHFIYKTNPCGSFVSSCDTPSSLSVWIQVPPYVLIAISEIFASITGLEYAYNKAPKRMKSVVMSVFLFMTAIGNAINAALSPVAEDPKLVGNYTGIAIASFLAGMAFYLCFYKRDQYEESENAIGKGHRTNDEVLRHQEIEH
ncbi:PTR2-domain-containing protein [Sistotremastrum suecicum HHB10207 ss-3]|uniref:PTR2-domain-containing protein n=1 Tax=Sistotremastrum suecicum HHB10207 ss-3 TaxID=1314776 RepID=A0A165YVQ5_9AGAM|nr:PTR2-domain-containing protein [Sistotremastrum suecicum HHB10207 ss-3]